MWTIRDSDGAETLHSIYPGWAVGLEHLTVTQYVPKAQLEALAAEYSELLKSHKTAQNMARNHIRVMKDNSMRMREVEAANNHYYSILQRYNLIAALPAEIDDTPLIDVKV